MLIGYSTSYSSKTFPYSNTFQKATVLTLIGWISAYGGLPSAISIAVIPRDQMSATQLYPISWITSGAIQNGVPITVFRFAMVSWEEQDKDADNSSCISSKHSLMNYNPNYLPLVCMHIIRLSKTGIQRAAKRNWNTLTEVTNTLKKTTNAIANHYLGQMAPTEEALL